jgi:peptidoglycan glycosyltransferase
VNRPIGRLFLVVLVMFAGLAGATSWWTVVKADELNTEYTGQNRRDVLRGLKVRRGLVRAADGTVLARSVRDREGIYSRRYPEGALFAHAVGYSYASIAQSGIEQSRNDLLSGERGELGNVFAELLGRADSGDDVFTTLDPKGQRAALQALGGRKGAVVAIEPETGAIRAMVSTPGYDPNSFRRRGVFGELSEDEANSPLLNRATQAGYQPGSTMKVATAIAAIDSGRFSPESRVNGRNGKEISGVPLNNFGRASYGDITLTEALTFSVNTVWAEVAETLGKATMDRYMDRLGFGADPPLDYPDDQMLPSGNYRKGRLIPPTSRFVDIGRMGIGQALLRVTPLQMAQVAAAVANDGELMEPRLVEKVVDRDGRTVEEIQPDEQSQVMSRESARQVARMMASVVREGSGTAAALQGIEVAGKTGTAEIDVARDIAQPWFIGFAPTAKGRIAVAATVERVQGGTGGAVAAPIARQVLEALL